MNESIAIFKLNAQRFAELSSLYTKLAEIQELLSTKDQMFTAQQEACKLHQQEIDRLNTEIIEYDEYIQSLSLDQERMSKVMEQFDGLDWYDLDNIQFLIDKQRQEIEMDSESSATDLMRLSNVMNKLKTVYTILKNEEGSSQSI